MLTNLIPIKRPNIDLHYSDIDKEFHIDSYFGSKTHILLCDTDFIEQNFSYEADCLLACQEL
jgi:hypothetical protein